MTASYRGYQLRAVSQRRHDGRWNVGVEIRRLPVGTAAPTGEGNSDGERASGDPASSSDTHDGERSLFYADDGIAYILETEALKEGLALGRILIDRNLV